MNKFLFLFFWVVGLFAQDPDILYLTWVGDPSTTMTVLWHTTVGDAPSEIRYKTLREETWQSQEGASKTLNRSNVSVHQVELTNLEEDTDYLFQIQDGEIHKFRTLPNSLNKRPLKVAIGGDAYLSKELFEKMNQEVASHDPDFVIMGGDIAYSEGLRRAFRTYLWKVERWEEFFRIWTKQMVTKDQRIIPIMPVIGNHDSREGFDNAFKRQVLFYEVFAFPQKGIPYQRMHIGSDINFYLLDSGHTFPIGGRQAEWLKKALQDNASASYNIPVYHIAAYPSEASFNLSSAKDIRKFWVPLFEKYGVKISMEHDNHIFKRTFPIRDDAIQKGGIVYLGDGAWGVFPRKPKKRWYLAKAAQTNCFWLLTFTEERCLCEAFNNEGQVLDTVQISAH